MEREKLLIKNKIKNVIVDVDKKELLSKYIRGEIDIKSDEFVYSDFESYNMGCILDCSLQELREMVVSDSIIISKVICDED